MEINESSISNDLKAQPALVIIDVQKAIDAPYHAKDGPRNNLQAEKVIQGLLTHWRQRGWPVIHIRHDSTDPRSAYRPGQDGNDFKPEVTPFEAEKVIAKQTNSAFIGTDLETYLRAHQIETLILTGVSTNNSVEATARMAGNLGFKSYLVEDACFTFGRRRGEWQWSAEEVQAMTLANLEGEYCEILTSCDIVRCGSTPDDLDGMK